MFTQEILGLVLQMASPQVVSSGKFSHEHHAPGAKELHPRSEKIMERICETSVSWVQEPPRRYVVAPRA